MNFKYRLPEALIKKAAGFVEYATGATQISIKLKNGTIFERGLLSNSTWIIALRGYDDLPFDPSDIEDVFQTGEDKHPKNRGGWHFWDKWE